MIKLFLGLLILTNTSFSIAARKDSADPREKADFDLYLNTLQNIGSDAVTPHAKAHFFSGDRPLSPPNKKDGKNFVLNFTKHQDKEGYSAFTSPWDDVKQYITNNANEINRSENKQAFTYTVNFENPLPAYKIAGISFPNNPNNDPETDCSKANIEKLARSNGRLLNTPSEITQQDQKKKLETFNGCLETITYTKQEHTADQAKFIFDKNRLNQIKTAYPVITPHPA